MECISPSEIGSRECCCVQYNADSPRWRKKYNNDWLVSGTGSSSSCQHSGLYSSTISGTDVRHQRSSVYHYV